ELAADDGRAHAALVVRVDGIREARERRGVERAFRSRPAVVRALRDVVDLFPAVLADVAAEEASVGCEAAAEGVPQTQRPALTARTARTDERVVRRYAAALVDAEDLAVQVAEILRVGAVRAAVADRHVELAVERAEAEPAGVVIAGIVGDVVEQDDLARRVDDV